MPIDADRPELLSSARCRTRQFLRVPCVYGSGNVWGMRCLLIRDVARRVILQPIAVFLFVRRVFQPLSDLSSADGDGDLTVCRHVDRLAQTRFAHPLQLMLHALCRPLSTVCVCRP